MECNCCPYCPPAQVCARTVFAELLRKNLRKQDYKLLSENFHIQINLDLQQYHAGFAVQTRGNPHGEVMTTFSDFWLNVLASIVAAILVAAVAKIALEKWKQLMIGIGSTAIAALIVSLIIFAGITVTKEVSAQHARSSLQDKIAAYTKGHYPEDVKKGYDVEVLEIRERVFLGFRYPDGEGYPSPHPLSNPIFDAEATRLLNDNGFPGSPVWGYPMKHYSAEQVEKLLGKV
jgi:hypothetical protein